MNDAVINRPSAYISNSCFNYYFSVRGVLVAQSWEIVEALNKYCFNVDWDTKSELLDLLFFLELYLENKSWRKFHKFPQIN
jgi:hypothetical protein